MLSKSSRSVIPLAKATNIRLSSSLPTSITKLLGSPPKEDVKLVINGYVRSVRQLKKITFVDLSDGSSFKRLMCIVSPEQGQKLKTGQTAKFTGNLIKSKGKGQEYEFKTFNDGVEIIGQVNDNYPLQKKSHSLQFLRTLPTLRWRSSYLSSILRFRSHLEYKLTEFFQYQGFHKVNAPVITSSDCEGAGELFQVEARTYMLDREENSTFFGETAYLTVSGQLHLETLCMALGKVWSLMPVFRAESSDTNRHLSEFWMLETEVQFADRVDQLTKLAEDMIKHILKSLVNDESSIATDLLQCQRSEDDVEGRISKLRSRWGFLLETQWKSITYGEAITILQNSGKSFKIPVNYSDGLSSEHEKWLAGEHFKAPLFVTDYPKDLKSFYMSINPDNETVACFDLLVPGIGEIIGGSLREYDLHKLTEEIRRRDMDVNSLDWYLSLRENSSAPHGGFGLGFERLICYLADIDNVRDVVPFPRSKSNCEC